MLEYTLDSFMSYTIGILVFFVGMALTNKLPILQKFHIPEPVTGGFCAALVIYGIYLWQGWVIEFDLSTRDRLLVYFFTAIGLNARFQDLLRGGKPLLVLLVLTIGFIVFQNLIGLFGAFLLDLPTYVSVMVGSASLIGGHGTAIAWAPDVQKQGLDNALEIGIANATLGLVIASLIGGPIARVLITRYQLEGTKAEKPVVGIAYEKTSTEQINHLNVMAVLLVLHVCIIAGYLLNELCIELGLKLPLYVTCLLMGIIFSNTVPSILPRLPWPARSRALAVVSDFSLSLFLTMSLMSMQLWTIQSLAGSLFTILFLQTLGAILYILFILFPLMGKNYQSAVLSAGFGGFALGATPTAIANMTAVTKAHSPAPMAFLILPLVAAFFVDVANAFVIQFFLSLG